MPSSVGIRWTPFLMLLHCWATNFHSCNWIFVVVFIVLHCILACLHPIHNIVVRTETQCKNTPNTLFFPSSALSIYTWGCSASAVCNMNRSKMFYSSIVNDVCALLEPISFVLYESFHSQRSSKTFSSCIFEVTKLMELVAGCFAPARTRWTA